MSEHTQAREKTDSGSAGPDAAVLSGRQRSERKRGAALGISRISFTQVALAVLAVILVWQWLAGHHAINEMQQQLARKVSEVDGISKAAQSLLTQSQDQVRDLSARLASLEARFAEAQNQRAALEALYADMSAGRDESVLAEVEQMLLTAGQQLQLSANVKVAIIALQNAEARLQHTNRAAFNELRRAINQDIGKLRSLPEVDISGANAHLDQLIASVDDLPLSYRQRVAAGAENHVVAPSSETTWQRLLREIAGEARQLVRIENTGKDEVPLLPPKHEFFLRENLKLRLMSARLSLMSRNEEGFRHELKTAQLWTTRYFDDKSAEGMQILAGLKKLASASIRIHVPDISSGLQAVRNFRLTHEGEPRVSFEQRPRASR